MTMRRVTMLVAGAVVLALGVAACGGGSGGARVTGIGFGITFNMPKQFAIAGSVDIGVSAGAQPAARIAVGIDNDNLIIFSRYDLRITVTKDKLSMVKAEVDKVIAQLAHKPVNGREVEYGGMPGYEYLIALRTPVNGVSRMAVLFDNKIEYLVNCQSTPNHRDDVDSGCQTVLGSLERA